jgi:hypothetical protein
MGVIHCDESTCQRACAPLSDPPPATLCAGQDGC